MTTGRVHSGRAPTSRAGTGRVLAWVAWDWGSASWNAVITTFVFTVYLTSSGFGSPEHTSGLLGTGLAIAGLLVALLAPVTGQRADRTGRATIWLAVNTAVVVAAAALMVLVRPTPEHLVPGVVLLAAGTLFFEFAEVNYNALITSVATPGNVGRVSGLGWGAGYIGGIVLLLVLLIGFILPDTGWFGVTHEDGMHVRTAMVVSALWFAVFAVPVLLFVRPAPAGTGERGSPEAAGGGILGAYRGVWRTLKQLRRDHPDALYFLVASAVFRDGLVGVFTFGGVLAAGTFGLSAQSVIIFGVAANVVAGVATIIGGLLDDAVGPKRIIVGSLSAMVVSGIGLFLAHDAGSRAFWILGLILCLFVGPAQSASRSLLARYIPAGREGEIFGLYATTGRAVSFLAPLAFSASIAVGGAIGPSGGDAQYWGTSGSWRWSWPGWSWSSLSARRQGRARR